MTLKGTRVMVVEDEAVVSMMLEEFLVDFGCRVVATAGTLEDALAKSNEVDMDAAILDINLGGKLSYPVATILDRRHIPFIFATGYGAAGLPVELKNVPILSKPFGCEQLEAVLRRTLLRS